MTAAMEAEATVMGASKMATIRLSVQGMAAGGEGVMSAWSAGLAVLSACGEATEVRWSASLALLTVVNRMAVASRKNVGCGGELGSGERRSSSISSGPRSSSASFCLFLSRLAGGGSATGGEGGGGVGAAATGDDGCGRN